jgi:curved DNA-binding protein
MSDTQEFIDYYAILQVRPNCDIKLIEGAYRHFAKIYHPDHEKTADVERFAVVIDAYNTLKFPHKRAEYDQLHQRHRQDPSAPPEPIVSSETALSDAALQRNILMFLYKARRENFQANGVGPYTMQEHFHCTDDNFAFHIWYLKSKGFLEVTEHGTLAITVDGVDHVISLHQPKAPDRLLTDQSQE